MTLRGLTESDAAAERCWPALAGCLMPRAIQVPLLGASLTQAFMSTGGPNDPVAASTAAEAQSLMPGAAAAPEAGGRANLPQTYITFFKSFVGIAILGLRAYTSSPPPQLDYLRTHLTDCPCCHQPTRSPSRATSLPRSAWRQSVPNQIPFFSH